MAAFKLGTKPSQTGGGATTWTLSARGSGRNQVSPYPLPVRPPGSHLHPSRDWAWCKGVPVPEGSGALIKYLSEDVIFFPFLEQLTDLLQSRKIPSPSK